MDKTDRGPSVLHSPTNLLLLCCVQETLTDRQYVGGGLVLAFGIGMIIAPIRFLPCSGAYIFRVKTLKYRLHKL